jgi:hypothetical protein
MVAARGTEYVYRAMNQHESLRVESVTFVKLALVFKYREVNHYMVALVYISHFDDVRTVGIVY